MDQPQTPSLEDARTYIYNMDFSKLIHKMVCHLGWLKRDATRLAELYRNFLFLNKKYGDQAHQLPPAEEIDEFWHLHILDTKQYHQDCQAIFGRYFHHYPYFGIDKTSNFSNLGSAFEKMLELHRKEFDYDVYKVKTIFSSFASIMKRAFNRGPKSY